MNEYLQGQTIEAIAYILCQEECSGKSMENSTVRKFASNWQMLCRSQYLYFKGQKTEAKLFLPLSSKSPNKCCIEVIMCPPPPKILLGVGCQMTWLITAPHYSSLCTYYKNIRFQQSDMAKVDCPISIGNILITNILKFNLGLKQK